MEHKVVQGSVITVRRLLLPLVALQVVLVGCGTAEPSNDETAQAATVETSPADNLGANSSECVNAGDTFLSYTDDSAPAAAATIADAVDPHLSKGDYFETRNETANAADVIIFSEDGTPAMELELAKDQPGWLVVRSSTCA